MINKMGVTNRKVPLTDDAFAAVHAAGEKLGMTQQAILQRVYEWFASQPPLLQMAVVGNLDDEDLADVIEVLWRRRHGIDHRAEITQVVLGSVDKVRPKPRRARKKKATGTD